jgi:lysophospholipase L1-like esterase
MIMLVALLFSLARAHDWQYDHSTDDTLSCDPAGVNHSKIVVAAVGDSITVGATCREWKGGYVKILSDLLESTFPGKYDVRDCGVCGTDAVRHGHGNLVHHSYWDQSAHNNSLAMKPDMVIYMLGTNDADEWGPCSNSSVHCGNTSAYYERDWKDMVNGYIALPNKPHVVTMIPPPYFLPHGFHGNWTCPATCPAFNDNESPKSSSPNNKEAAKACVIDCILPTLVPKLTASVGLAPPISLFGFFGGVDSTNKTLMPGLHPDCDGYTAIAHYLVKQLFQKA